MIHVSETKLNTYVCTQIAYQKRAGGCNGTYNPANHIEYSVCVNAGIVF